MKYLYLSVIALLSLASPCSAYTYAGASGENVQQNPFIAALGGGEAGKALFQAADAAAQRTAIGSPAIADLPTWSTLTGKPSVFPPDTHTHTFGSLTSKPTTLTGYGITDAASSTHTHAASDITSGTLGDARIASASTWNAKQSAITFGTGVQTAVGVNLGSAGGLAAIDGTATLTNKSISLGSNSLTGTTAQFNTALTDGDFATLAGSEALTNKTYNGMTITANSGTFAVANAKSAIISNTLTFTGTDGSNISLGVGGTVVYASGVLGTPTSGNLINCTFPTLNQSTTGSAATLTTSRTINGVSFNGSANIGQDLQTSASPTFAQVNCTALVASANVICGDTNSIFVGLTRSRINSPANGQLTIWNTAKNDFSRLNFGGETSSFPAIKRSSATLAFRLADDSADAAITSGGLAFPTAGQGITYKSGTNARAGNATLTAGTVTISNNTVTANTIISLTRKTSGGTIGTSITYTLSAGASFTITSDNILDTSTFSYLLVETN